MQLSDPPITKPNHFAPWIIMLLGGAFLTVVCSPIIMAVLSHYREYGGYEDHKLPETYRRGNMLIEHLLNYRADHGAFPPRLDNLISAGVAPEILPPTWGDRVWVYRNERESIDLVVQRFGKSYPGISNESAIGWRSGRGRDERSRAPEALDLSRRRGWLLVEAITKFRRTEGRMPDTLEELVERDYLKSVEPPGAGDAIWLYERTSTRSAEKPPKGVDPYSGDEYRPGYSLRVYDPVERKTIDEFFFGDWYYDS